MEQGTLVGQPTMATPAMPGPLAVQNGRRARAAEACHRAGLLPLLERMRRIFRGGARILAYHRVLESSEPHGFTFDVDLVSASAEAFHRQMSLVRRKFHPMRFDELLDCLERGQRPPPRAVLVTFDDGYDDNYRVAFPILRELGMSAMFFVSTGHIESGEPYAYDWLVHMLCSAPQTRLDIPALGISAGLPEDIEGRRALARQVLDRIKALDAGEQDALIAGLEDAWGMPRARTHPQSLPMRWEQLREMRRMGMEIGSHGVRHRMLAKLPPDEMRHEVFESRRMLERELGGEVQVISYPVGGSDAYDERVVAAVREAGYRMACSYRAGADPVTRATRYGMRRLPVERQMGAGWFEAIVTLPEVFAHASRSREA